MTEDVKDRVSMPGQKKKNEEKASKVALKNMNLRNTRRKTHDYFLSLFVRMHDKTP